MPFNLLKTVQQNLGYPELRKVDPNTQDVVFDTEVSTETKLGQAAIPAVLTGLYKYIESDEGLSAITSTDVSKNWIEAMFIDSAGELREKVAAYSSLPVNAVKIKLDEIANESVRLLKEHIHAQGSILNARDFMLTQRNNILPCLPAALHIGRLLKEPTLDDRTNKMKGPVSDVMHGIESIFAGSDNSDKSDKF